MSGKDVIDVQRFLNEHPFSRLQWLIFAMCFVIVVLDGFDTAAVGFIAPSLIAEWHVQKSSLGPVLSAALFGLAFGAIVSGPLSDRWGRRGLLIGSVALFGVASLACVLAGSLTQLTVLRFVTGVGLGAAMPNAVTLVGEYCPDRRRATLVNLMFCGFPLGAAVGGFLAAWMIPQFGWRSVLVLGGVVPLVLAAILLAVLPESVRYLVAKGKPAERIRDVLRRISPDAATIQAFTLREAAAGPARKSDMRLVLSGSYIVGSLMLWITYFMGLVIFYGLINWMPVLFKEAGFSAGQSTLLSALFPLGGVGAVVCGMLMDRFNATKVVAGCYALTALSVYAIGQSLGSVGALIGAILVAGVLMNTAQCSMPALAAAFYPTQGRATGVAWMLGVGRFGGIAGSFLVAELSLRHLSLEGIFSVVAVAGVISCVALLVKVAACRDIPVVQPVEGEPVHPGH
ncbi:4-hydroxybenzoate transporter [Bordetella sp. H567]|uniref:MFS transporter n=1 Tax=Bordetella sp. H567 TaxID=1697043 RepID=UPI00081D0185|nr:MFS transporter [Bordetella sp. H567]AOB30843.1 4-hydroxybenzoate transporter [Bordetella sp. H567]